MTRCLHGRREMAPRIRSAGLLAAACAVAPAAQAARAAAEQLVLQPLEDPLAVCSDGSPAGYYWGRAPTEEGSRLWIVYLEGGGWCYDAGSCGRRCPKGTASPLCNSKGWASRLALGDYPCGPGSPDELCGIFAPASGSRLRDANKVYVRYCSSDAFMGDSSAFGMEFRGTRIVAAVLRDLASRRALGLAREGAEDTLLFGGGSAGARGALVHLDYVKSMLKIPDASNLVVKGFFDSPLWLDTEPFKGSSQQRAGRHHPAELSFPEQARRVFEYAKVGHLGRDCERRHRADSAWKCTFGQYRLPSVETPYLLVASQYDEFQLSAYVGHRPRGREETAYAKRLAHETVAVLWELISPDRVLLSWACWSHMLSTQDRFSEDLCRQRVTMLDAVEQFLGLAPASSDLYWIDTCEGVDCGRCAASPRMAEQPRLTAAPTSPPASTATATTGTPTATATTNTWTATATTRTSTAMTTTITTTLSTASSTVTPTATTLSSTATTMSSTATSESTTATATSTTAISLRVLADAVLGSGAEDLEEPPPTSPAAAQPLGAPARSASLPVEGPPARARERSGRFMLAGALACLLLLPSAWVCVRCTVPGAGRSSFVDAYTRAADAYSLVRQDGAAEDRDREDGRWTSDEDFWRWSRAAVGLPEPRSGSREGALEESARSPRGCRRGAKPPTSRTATSYVQVCRGDVVDFDDMARDMETSRPSMPAPKPPVGVGRLVELWSLFVAEEPHGTPRVSTGARAQATDGWWPSN
mmetsp:Transcript_63070/g.167670  ORF Transcript_63070/g.167670 Transcript_63070/m.167670 type:complete len:759 (-) Transcript_63070:104-2380(-)